MESLAIYFTVFLFGTLLLKQASLKKNTFNIAGLIGLTIIIMFAAGRYHVGTDTGTYIHMFERFLRSSWQSVLSENSDYLFLIISKITYTLGGRVLTFGTFAALTAVPTYFALRDEYPQTSFGIAFFAFLSAYYSTSFNITRQMVSVALIFWGIKFIFKNQPIKYALLIVFAAGIHTSALLAIPMWFLWDHKNSTPVKGSKRLTILIVVTVAVFFYQLLITRVSTGLDVFSRFDSYALSSDRGKNRDFYIYLIELIIVLMLKQNLIKIDERNDFLISLHIISVLIGITGFSHPQVKRLAYYYAMPARMILAGYLPYCFSRSNSRVIKALTYVWFSAIFIITAYILGEANLIPYHFDLVSPY